MSNPGRGWRKHPDGVYRQGALEIHSVELQQTLPTRKVVRVWRVKRAGSPEILAERRTLWDAKLAVSVEGIR